MSKQENHTLEEVADHLDVQINKLKSLKSNIMAVTIMEALQNANYNIKLGNSIGLMVAKEQLNNAVVLLEKGYDINEEVEPLLEEFGDAESVPKKQS